MTTFDVAHVSLQGLNLIEASAGTGKTYTLAELYLRLLLEHELTVNQILVVTYTRAATEELRDRLRQKLVDERDQRIKQGDVNSKVINRLNLAIQSFDEAAIFTIHGFCQRVLADYAFESGVYFELELIGDDLSILQSAADDFWRKYVTTADKDFVAYLLAKNETADKLLQSVKDVIAKPYLQCLPVIEMNVEQLAHQLQLQFERVKSQWLIEQEQVIATLTNKSLLNGNKYRTTSVEKWLANLQELLENKTLAQGLFAGFERFTPAKLEDAIKKGQVLPELGFWKECELLQDCYQQLQQARDIQHQALRFKLVQYLRETVPLRKQQQQVLSYDDLLVNLEQALNGKQGAWLVERLQEHYQAALIDEFQDTDPIQYANFSRLFSGSGLPVFLVGDPKQAIYSFRGADIFTYLKAKAETEHQHSLTTNWRSHPHLVSAINHLFGRQSEPFLHHDIPFYPVDAAREIELVLEIEGDNTAPLHLLWAGSEKTFTKQTLTVMAANATANEIARILNRSQRGEATLFDEKSQKTRAITGGDIAVLVRSHRQAQTVQSCLQTRGINSVQQGRQNVFESPQAQMLQRVLLAIAEPNNETRIKAALSSKLWGLTANELYQIEQDETQWQTQLKVFHDLHQLWLEQGFMRLFRQLLVSTPSEQTIQQQLLALPDGERQLTNLLHLAELIQQHCNQQGEGIQSVLQYLAACRQSVDPNDETVQLRLESDEQLVKIITIHKSKGLEYPIVFCPFLWDANLRAAKKDVIVFHQNDQDKTATVAFSEPALSQATEPVRYEERAEELRLLYVALTRARERCVVLWGDVNSVETSALFSLLHPHLEQADTSKMKADLTELARTSNGTISVDDLHADEVIHYQQQDNKDRVLAARQFRAAIQLPWRIGSFSALTQGHDAEFPDYDADNGSELQAIVPLAMLDRFSFPRGAQAGSCLHAIFEVLDFTDQQSESLQQVVSHALLQYGFDEKWLGVVCQWITEVLHTPLPQSTVMLADLKQSQRLDELEFYLPVANLSVTDLQQKLLPLLDKNSPLAITLQRLHFYKLTGFMKGFIDLVFEDQGRYFVVDYKSNYLGNTPQDYQLASLNDAMIEHDYPLQYLLYSAALHRYLKLRLANYQPEKHLGGVYYLFIRGMKTKWGESGIFYDKLAPEVLEAFDACLQGIDDE